MYQLTRNSFTKEVGDMTGKFVVIEGLDATGKSTLIKKLVKRLNAIGLPVHRN